MLYLYNYLLPILQTIQVKEQDMLSSAGETEMNS